MDVLGYTAAIFATGSFIPQVWKTWRTRSAEDISFLMLFLHITGMVLWGTYGFLMGAAPIVVANAIAIVLDFVLIGLKMRAPGERAVSPPQSSKV